MHKHAKKNISFNLGIIDGFDFSGVSYKDRG